MYRTLTIRRMSTIAAALSLLCAPVLAAISVSPSTATVSEGAQQQFTASAAATWKTNCGTVSSTGLLTASLYAGRCSVTATSTGDGTVGTASVTVTSPVIMTPPSAQTPQGTTQQFTANLPVTWVAKCGTITATGLFTATSPPGTYCTIEAIATGTPRYTAYGWDQSVAGSTFSISPLSPSVSVGNTQQFTATSAATWTASCGTMNASSGLYTAPVTTGSCSITAKSSSGQTASTAANIIFSISPANPQLSAGATQQFTATSPATWTASCGTINGSTGAYTAPATAGSCTITAMATAGGATATAAVTVTSSASLIMTPVSARTPQGTTQQFTANMPVTWIAKCGTITAGGLFTATSAPNTYCTIEAISTGSPTHTVYGWDQSIANTTFTILPLSPQLSVGTTQQFTASSAATWTASCGAIDANTGFYTAPATIGSCTITAKGSGGQTASTITTVVFSISPMQPHLSVGATQQFTASSPATWSAACGTIDRVSGLYTAPSTTGPCTITAQAQGGQAASTDADVEPPAAVSPNSPNLHALGTQQFSTNVAVSWSASCGSITSAGLFTAPATAGACNITATATDGGATGQAIATVTLANYTAWKNSAGGVGAETDEYQLTPGNVAGGGFSQSWSATVDGLIWSQPLYLNAITVGGTARNVVFAATSNDSVYAFDGDTGAQLWQTSFLSPGVTAVAGTSLGVYQQTGVLSTPVIDPTTNTLYVVAETSENSATYFPHRLHALDVTTGQEKFGGPVLITDPALPPVFKFQRPALLLANGNIYVGFGSIEDKQPYHGLLFAFSASTLSQKAVFNSTPSGSEGGIWMSGAAPTSDENGNIYISTGNGTFDGTNNFGESIVKLSANLQELDFFTPFNWPALNSGDVDLGSGDVLVVPLQSGPFPHELIVCGKPTPIYLLNRDALGGIGTTSDHVLQVVDKQLGASGNFRDSGQPCYNTPSMWGQNVYFVANHDVMKMFSLNPGTGLLSTTPVSKGTFTYAWPGAMPVVSSNGANNGIVWTMDLSTRTLRANDATDVSKVLYVSPQFAAAIRWTVPTVINGHVYVSAQGKLIAYSLH